MGSKRILNNSVVKLLAKSDHKYWKPCAYRICLQNGYITKNKLNEFSIICQSQNQYFGNINISWQRCCLIEILACNFYLFFFFFFFFFWLVTWSPQYQLWVISIVSTSPDANHSLFSSFHLGAPGACKQGCVA